MTELSQPAQKVFWAFNRAASGKPDDWHYLPAVAAALRAAADQVVPDEELIMSACAIQRAETRDAFLAIAAELRGANPTNQED